MSAARRPSRLARRLLRWALPDDRHDDITGDLDEVFEHRRRAGGLWAARLWYWREALMLVGRFGVERVRDRRQREPDAWRCATAPARSGLLGLASGVSSIDVKLGLRMLVKYPGLTLVSTAALAIAIAIVAGFHAGTQFMVRPTLPVPDGDRVVAIWQHDVTTGELGTQTLGDMLTWQRELETLEHVGGFVIQERAVTLDGATRLVSAAQISPSVFEMLRVPPWLGRPLVEDDARPGGPAVALIGFDLWQTALDADPAIVGKTIRLAGAAHTVVGVMPSGFAFPRREELWTPLPVSGASSSPDAGPSIDFTVARLAPGATLDEVEAELRAAGASLAAAYPDTHARLRPRVARYARSFLAANEPGLPLLMQAARLAIGVLLLVVAVNVGTLIYARNAARLGEIAVRTALGASRRRVVLQMFIEALMLSSAAAAVGVAVLLWPLHLLRETFSAADAQGDAIPYWIEIGFGPSTALLVVGLTVLSAVLTGVLPALKVTGSQTQARLQRVQEGSSGLRFGRTTTLVVVSQVALSVALLTVGGAQLRTFIKDWWSRDDSGMPREQFLTAQLRWDLGSDAREAGATGDVSARPDTWRELGRRAAGELDVRGVTFGTFQGVRFFVPDTATAQDGSSDVRWTYLSAIEPNYFDVQGVPVRAGRALSAGDLTDAAPPVAVVNEAFVQAMLPAGDPIGRRVRQFDLPMRQASGEPMRIVGVVRDTPSLEISQRGPAWVARPTAYVPLQHENSSTGVRMLLRARGEPERLVGRLHALAADVDPTLVLHQPLPLDEVDRVGLTLVGLYGLAVGFFVFAALLLSATGVYAMMSFTVTQRTREIGIRTALGAPAGRVVGAIFSRAMTQLGAGTALGLGLGYLAADGPFALSGGLFAEGPGVIAGVAALILALGLIACGRPMRRALRVEPTVALRADG